MLLQSHQNDKQHGASRYGTNQIDIHKTHKQSTLTEQPQRIVFVKIIDAARDVKKWPLQSLSAK